MIHNYRRRLLLKMVMLQYHSAFMKMENLRKKSRIKENQSDNNKEISLEQF